MGASILRRNELKARKKIVVTNHVNAHGMEVVDSRKPAPEEKVGDPSDILGQADFYKATQFVKAFHVVFGLIKKDLIGGLVE